MICSWIRAVWARATASSCRSTWIYAVDPARDLGYRKLILTADPHSEPFYTRCGAVPIGEKTSTTFPGRKLPVMEYSLVDRIS
jgi:hypothetical protein